jgi:hypothetical protein
MLSIIALVKSLGVITHALMWSLDVIIKCLSQKFMLSFIALVKSLNVTINFFSEEFRRYHSFLYWEV